MKNFDDVLSQLVTLLRRSDAGGFVPRKAPRSVSVRRAEVDAHSRATQNAASRGAALVSYRDVYRCPTATWGQGAFVPPAPCPKPVEPCGPAAAAPSVPEQSVKMPFRIFD